jgi:aspartyl aminopeptidase
MALREPAPRAEQRAGLTFVLDALDHDSEAQVREELDQGADQSPGAVVVSDVADIAAVDLDDVGGQSVQVANWGPCGSATVKYRGAEWQARFIGTGLPEAGGHTIRALEGSTLLLDR